MIDENKNQILREAAGDFTKKANMLSSVLEIVIAGSVAGGDPYPNDFDIAIIVDSLDELEKISKYARQMSGYYHGWEVFLFDENLLHLGRICHRKECPSRSIDCCMPGCGDLPHLRIHSGFKYDEKFFYPHHLIFYIHHLKKAICLPARVIWVLPTQENILY